MRKSVEFRIMSVISRFMAMAALAKNSRFLVMAQTRNARLWNAYFRSIKKAADALGVSLAVTHTDRRSDRVIAALSDLTANKGVSMSSLQPIVKVVLLIFSVFLPIDRNKVQMTK